jgi:hypothetical protein
MNNLSRTCQLYIAKFELHLWFAIVQTFKWILASLENQWDRQGRYRLKLRSPLKLYKPEGIRALITAEIEKKNQKSEIENFHTLIVQLT